MSAAEGDKNNAGNKTTAFPIDLAPKVLVRPTTDKLNMPTAHHATYRTINNPQMRLVFPATTGIQSNYIRQAMNLKQVDTSRAQITALPPRTVTQTSITVSRPQTPTTYHVPARVPTSVVTNVGPRGPITTTIRTPPVNVTNIPFVRQSIPTSRTSSPSASITIPQSATNWIQGNTGVHVQVPAQLIRATSIGQVPRPRVVTQTIPTNPPSNNLTNATITANVITQQVSQGNQQNQVGNNTYVATLATVLPPKPQTATLLYTNSQQPYSTGNNQQRLTLTTSLAAQRHVRPLQRLPTTGIRVSASNISIRPPSVPILAPTNVLTTISNNGQRPTGSVSTANLTTNTIPARIIQVQPQQPGTTAQVISARTLQTNLMTLQPIIVNNNRQIVNSTTQIQPSLTIAQIGKLTGAGNDNQNASNNLASNLPPGSTIQTVVSSNQPNNQSTAIITGNLISNQSQSQQPQQITQILNVNPSHLSNQTHQIVTVTQSHQSSTATVVPLALATSRNTGIPVSVATLSGQNQINIVSSANAIAGLVRGLTTTTTTSSMPTILPIAKVLPQLTGNSNDLNLNASSSITQHTGTSVYIQARAPQHNMTATSLGAMNNQQNKGVTVVSGTTATVIPSSGTTFYYEHVSSGTTSSVSTTTSVTTTPASVNNPVFSISSNVINSTSSNQINTSNVATNIVSSIPYTPSAGSFAVVPTSNRNIVHGIIPASSSVVSSTIQSQQQAQTVPLRFNPQLLIDGGQGQQIIMTGNVQSGGGGQQSTHMLIPCSKLESPRASILRKRDSEGSPIKVKNLTQALMAMGKDRERAHDNSPPSRPPSSDGSTTVSATSSPGLDQQEQEGMVFANQIKNEFKPVDEPFLPAPSTTQQINQNATNGNYEQSPRKKPRKQQLQPSNENANPVSMLQHLANESENHRNASAKQNNNNILSANNVNAKEEVAVGAEGVVAIPTEITVKKPQPASLLQSYKQNWKAANNHFQRYTDVRQRDERRQSVMDLANQAHVLQKVNGWKIYHLTSQIEDLSNLETQAYDKLGDMLRVMETSHKSNPEIERVNDLLKGNMQRSKIIIDGIKEARTQIMKIFDHKPNVADIIHRCASKRNFKKREKT